MFTTEEQPLLTGTPKDILEFANQSEHSIIADWRGTEEDVLNDIVRFLPAKSLTFEITYPNGDNVRLRIRFRDREDTFELPAQPDNNLRALLHVWRILQPEYDIKIFRCMEGADANFCLLRPSAWWAEYRDKYPQQYQNIFCDITDLAELWKHDAPIKPWWRFW